LVTHTGYDDCAQLGLADNALQSLRKVLQHDDGGGARVAQLMCQLARRIERVGIDDRQTGEHCPIQRNGILQHIRQHERDAIAFAHFCRVLQPSGKLLSAAFILGIAERRPQTGVRRQIGELLAASADQRLHRLEFVGIDGGRHADRIVFQPDFLHGPPQSLLLFKQRLQYRP
jgi:hypothetical protein